MPYRRFSAKGIINIKALKVKTKDPVEQANSMVWRVKGEKDKMHQSS